MSGAETRRMVRQAVELEQQAADQARYAYRFTVPVPVARHGLVWPALGIMKVRRGAFGGGRP